MSSIIYKYNFVGMIQSLTGELKRYINIFFLLIFIKSYRNALNNKKK